MAEGFCEVWRDPCVGGGGARNEEVFFEEWMGLEGSCGRDADLGVACDGKALSIGPEEGKEERRHGEERDR